MSQSTLLPPNVQFRLSPSNNILKAYQAIDRHIQKHPEEAKRFPNFTSERKTILAKGCDGPVDGERHFAQYFHGRSDSFSRVAFADYSADSLIRDGLSGIADRHPDLNVDDIESQAHPQLEVSQAHGVDVALDLLRLYPSRTVTYVVLGPMTNLYHMMKKGGDMVRDRIGRIISMGGALDVPGNTSPVAECWVIFSNDQRLY